MMSKVFREIYSFLAGVVLAFALVILVELFSSVVHPVPPGFKGTMDEMCQHVARYPDWVLAIAVVLWGGTALLSTWVSSRLGSQATGVALGLLLQTAVVFNVSQLPYPMWFKVVIVVVVPISILLGLRWSHRGTTTEIP